MTLKLTDKQILDYKKDGVILIKKAFLPWIEKLSKGFQKVLNKPSSHGRENVSKQHGGRFFEDYCNWQRIDEFKDFIFNSPAAEIVAQSTQSNKIQVFHEHIFLKEPGTKKETPWHQDLPYYWYRNNKNFMDMPNIDKNNIFSTEMNIGDAILFNFKVLHSSSGNSDKKSRKAFSARFIGDDVRYIDRKGETSPPFAGIDLKPGDKMRKDWFPVVWSN